MLHRFLFVAGMTAGVMTPLVWAAYMARPAAPAVHNARGPALRVAKAVTHKAAPHLKKLTQIPAEDVTASIPPASAAMPEAMHSRRTAVVAAHRANNRTLPAVVDSYNGAHIITVCAALTENEQLRAGCP